MPAELLYFHDPMCSWCWAFRPAFHALVSRLPAGVTIRRVVGGLAPDTDQPMPAELRTKLEGTWHTIQETVPGTAFNFDYWRTATPRRSTYPACRAVIAATRLSPADEDRMIEAIQHAYYLEARNPSDVATLIDLADQIGLNRDRFAEEIASPAVEARLREEIAFARQSPIQGFPSLVLRTASGLQPIETDFTDPDSMLAEVEAILRADGRS